MLKIVLAILVTGNVASAVTLEQAIEEAATAYQVDARVLTAIAFLESSGGKFTGPKVNKNGTVDLGAFQINSVHWATTCSMYKVDTLRGNALCAARLLKQHKKFRGTDSDWMGRYHSRTPSKKVKYAKKIKAFLANSDK
jgi:hypothetical protein